MIRNDENVKGIKINGKEYKLSQYADDTQLFLDGSELSLHSALSILNKLYNMSGININFIQELCGYDLCVNQQK